MAIFIKFISNLYQYYIDDDELKDIIGLYTNVQVRNTENVCIVISHFKQHPISIGLYI